LPDLFEVFAEAWDKRLGSEDPVEEIIWKDAGEYELRDTGFKLLERYITDIAPSVQPKKGWVEKKLTRELKGKYVDGFQARLDLVDTKNRIIDHKTVKRLKSEDECQRDSQPLAYMFARNKPGAFEWHLAHKGKNQIFRMAIERSREDLDWFEKEFLPPIIRQIDSGIFPIKPGWWCGWCPYIAFCRLPQNTRVYSLP
jgi:hypothetical protein